MQEELINEQTEKEIVKNDEQLNDLQLEINEEVAKELEKTENAKRQNLIKKLDGLVDDFTLSKVGLEELQSIRKSRLENLKKYADGEGIFAFDQTDYFELLDNELNGQLTFLKNSALNTFDDYIQFYENEKSRIISNPPKSFKYDTLEELEKLASELSGSNMRDKFLVEDDVSYFLRSDGKKERAEYWYDRNVRAAYTREADEQRRQDMAEYGHDLVRVSAHSDSSELCAPYQGKIFSEFGRSDRYKPLQTAIDGGLRHINCRHLISEYFPGLSTPTAEIWGDNLTPKVSDKERKEAYARRQQGKYNRRQAKKYDDRYRRAKAMGDEEKAREYRNKRIAFNKRATALGVN